VPQNEEAAQAAQGSYVLRDEARRVVSNWAFVGTEAL